MRTVFLLLCSVALAQEHNEADHHVVVRANESMALREALDNALACEYLAALAQAQVGNAVLVRDNNLFDNGVIAERRLLESKQRAFQQSLQVNAWRQRLQLADFDCRYLRQLESDRQLRADYCFQGCSE